MRGRQIPVSRRAHYRELGMRLRRADVTETGNCPVENFLKDGLAVRWSSLAGGNIGRFGEAEGQPTAFFETNRDRRSLARGILAL